MAAHIDDAFSCENKSSQCWPRVRFDYISKALDAHGDGDTEKGIYYETKALCCGYLANKAYSSNGGTQGIDVNTLSDAVEIRPDKAEDRLIKFVTEKMNAAKISATHVTHPSTIVDDMQKLYDKCAQLPREWNVVQLVKAGVKHTAYGTKRDVCMEPAPISITLFRHALSDKMNDKPLHVHLTLTDDVWTAAYELFEVTFKAIGAKFHDPGIQRKIKSDLPKLISNIKTSLGPWITFFTGKIKGADGRKIESEILAAVNAFVATNVNYTPDQKLLLSLVSRRIDLLDSITINAAAEHIASTSEQFAAISKFLAGIKTTYKFDKCSYYPCILIIDEYLDKIPWELFAPREEIARFSSIYTLFDMYDEYKSNISDGYLKVRVATGTAVINPDKDEKLNSMEERIDNFISLWLPKWDRTVGGAFDAARMNELYATGDAFFYAGHGSSLQFVDATAIDSIKTKSILFLFGCESNAIKLQGLVAEPTSAHLRLCNSKCPAICGANYVITDSWTDMISIGIMSSWIPSKKSQFKKPILMSKEIQDIFEPLLSQTRQRPEPSVLRIMAEIRELSGIILRMRAAFIYRGLPMYNILAES